MQATAQTPAEALALAEEAQARCDHAAAERWGLRAARLAGEDDPLASYLGRRIAGWSLHQRGDQRAALRVFRRVQADVEAAPALEERRAAVYHDLFAVHHMAGGLAAAEEHFRRGSHLYRPEDPRRLSLEADRANGFRRVGQPGEAVVLYRPLLERLSEHPRLYLTHFSNFAVALAGAGYEREAREALGVLRSALDATASECAAWGWLSLARALHLLGDRGRETRSAAATGRRIAAARGEEDTRREAAALLLELHRRG